MCKQEQKRAQKQRVGLFASGDELQSYVGSAARTESEIASRVSRPGDAISFVIIAASRWRASTSGSGGGDFIFHENGN